MFLYLCNMSECTKHIDLQSSGIKGKVLDCFCQLHADLLANYEFSIMKIVLNSPVEISAEYSVYL